VRLAATPITEITGPLLKLAAQFPADPIFYRRSTGQTVPSGERIIVGHTRPDHRRRNGRSINREQSPGSRFWQIQAFRAAYQHPADRTTPDPDPEIFLREGSPSLTD